MILDQINISVPTEMKIMQFFVLNDGTFLLIVKRPPLRRQTMEFCLIHMQQHGEVMYQKSIQDPGQKILVIGDNQVLLTIMNARKLALIDFITSQVMQIPFSIIHFGLQNACRLQTCYFPQSDLIWVGFVFKFIRPGTQYELTKMENYFFVPHSFARASQIVDMISDQHDQSIDFCQMSQANNHSLVVIRREKKLEIETCYELTLIDFPNYVGSPQFHQYAPRTRRIQMPWNSLKNYNISNVWQVNPELLLLVPYHQKYPKLLALDINSKKVHQFSDKMNFIHDGFYLQGSLSGFICLHDDTKNEKDESSYFLIKNSSSSKPFTVSKQNSMRKKYYDFQGFVLLEGYLYKENNTVNARYLRPLQKREIYMQMLEHLNQDFDDDLLNDTLAVIGCL